MTASPILIIGDEPLATLLGVLCTRRGLANISVEYGTEEAISRLAPWAVIATTPSHVDALYRACVTAGARLCVLSDDPESAPRGALVVPRPADDAVPLIDAALDLLVDGAHGAWSRVTTGVGTHLCRS